MTLINIKHIKAFQKIELRKKKIHRHRWVPTSHKVMSMMTMERSINGHNETVPAINVGSY